ncbi:MAG: RiPP maturation radical SAM C-methyltransferase [Desulfobacterales bacterium]|nr:MAG: RiPP maturation radical SAM C-methyltransferase [Desulfobacterales bacterium]
MSDATTAGCSKIALISTPWPLYSRPSMQLGTLKAYLKAQVPDLAVEAHHFYLNLAEALGYQLYHSLSERTWLAETVYAALLFPERLQIIKKLFDRQAGKKSPLGNTRFETLTSSVKAISDAFMDRVDWRACRLAGFSVSLCQLTSTLYFIRRLKQKYPHLIIVMGGSSLAGEAALDLFAVFPEVDAVVQGEGEIPLFHLVRHLRNSPNLNDLPPLPGLCTSATAAHHGNPASFCQLENLSRLPAPDYDEYFQVLQTFHPAQAFFPTLPMEISRGCWWQQSSGANPAGGCAFCNLNLQWQGYRSKGPAQVVSEIDHLTGKHRTLSVAVVDNVLPKNKSREIFQQLGRLDKDLRLFCEIRATTPAAELKVMRDAGLQRVQIGIESLSTRLLKKMHKGSTAIQNLEIMKNCEVLGIQSISNLMGHFPGSDAQDVAENLRTMEFALPYRPLNFVGFWLGLGSPVWRNAQTYGITAVFNHPNWAHLFPTHMLRSLRLVIQAYRGDKGYQKKLWRPVEQKIKDWEKTYRELHQDPSAGPILSLRDGQDFLIIRQRRVRSKPFTHRLTGTSRAIYLHCQRHRSLQKILSRFTTVPSDEIVAFLRMMVAKKLMFAEDGKYLSLAVPVRPTRWERWM